MLTIYHRVKKEAALSTIDNFQTGCWVNAVEPTEAELDRLISELNIDRGLLRDGLDEYEVPRLETEDGTTYVFTRAPERHDEEIHTHSLLAVVGNKFILTVAREKSEVIESFLNGKRKDFTTEKTKFFIEFFSAINHAYNFHLHEIRKRLRAIKVRLERVDTKDIVQFVEFERILNDFLSALEPINSVLEKLLKGRFLELDNGHEELVEDLFLDNKQLIHLSNSTLKQVVNIRDAYSHIATQELNRAVKLLTSLTVLLAVPTMIFSFYGMNIRLPLASLNLIYLPMAGFTILVTLLLYFIFIRNRWL